MRPSRVFLALVLLLAPPAQSGGPPDPPPASDWIAAAQVAAGKCIAVTGHDQVQHKLKLVAWSDEGLKVSDGRGRLVFYPKEQVRRIGVYRRCSSSLVSLYGALLGFTVGFGATAILAGGLCTDCSEGGTGVLGATAAGAAVAVVSALVAARSSDQPVRWIYEKR